MPFDVISNSRMRGSWLLARVFSTVSARFVRVLELLDEQAPAEALHEALRQHDAALREFRTFADLK